MARFQRMRWVDGEMRRAVELLVASDIAELPTIGKRPAGFDLEPDNSHRFPSPSMRRASYQQFEGPARHRVSSGE